MPRTPMDAPPVSEMMNQLSLAAIMQVITQERVKMALEETGTASVRQRLLPAHMLVYLVVMLAFFAEASVRENVRRLIEVLRHTFGRDNVKRPCDSAVSQARQRLGPEPLIRLFDELACPVGDPSLTACFWRDFRTVAADGTTIELQDTQANRNRFGIHSNQHGPAGYPQMKAVVLVECGTRVPLACALGKCDDYEPGLFDQLLPKLQKDMMMLADRHYYDYARWKACSQRAGALLWRVKDSLRLTPIKVFDDGSYLARIRPSNKLTEKGLCQKDESMIVRVIEYRPVFEDGTEGDRVRLITTLLDPIEAPAEELARLYAERWSEETGFDELKTHLRGPDRVLRSPLPDLVVQEWYGFLLAYYVVRATMAEAARAGECSPRELSFVGAVRIIQGRLNFSPGDGGGDGRSVQEYSGGHR